MRCPSCGWDNPAEKKFCSECGARLAQICPQCGAENSPAAKFCGDCGAGLARAVGAATQPTSLLQTPEAAGERRHLTVLFCDLAGSTAIAAQLDPEEWRETVSSYHRAAAEAITRFDGHVAKYLGDGVMAFFGYPQAHDNDAEQAVRAGLAILDSITTLNERPGQPNLSARVGIDSGAVVVGPGAGREAEVFGDTPNIAARVQEAAAPGTVLVTEDTHRLISGLFVVEGRGAPPLKGIQRPLQLYRVVRPSGVRGRLEAAAASRGLTPFVGRQDELQALMHRWRQVLDGRGQVALIIGEPGIGKSRLLQRFHEQIAATPHTWIEAGAGAFFQNSPFYPVTEMLKQALGWHGDEPAEQQVAQLESALEMAGLKPAEAVPLLAPMLNLPPTAKYPPLTPSPEQQRRRLLATLVDWTLGLARAQPTVITIEDLHWADPSTLELIGLLVEQGAQARLLLLCTARPEFRAQWPLRAHHTQMTLNRLSARDVRSMVRQVAARNALSQQTIATVVERTGGVPLFVEELTRAVLESGDAKATGREIPATLHDSLLARLDRLGPAKEVIQVGAVIGSEFSYDMLHAVFPIAEADLQSALRKLTDAELLYVRGLAPEASYQFKHALIRDAAYEALLKSRRKELHRQVAHTIDERFTALGESHPEVLARHWTEAGETEPAIAQWSRAAETAAARNGFAEALESYHQALGLVKLQPESPGRDSRELSLGQSVVRMLGVRRGFCAPETTEAIKRVAALAEKSGNLAELGAWVRSRCIGAWQSGDLRAAGALADQTLDLALREDSATNIAFAYFVRIECRNYLGDLAGAEQDFAAGLAFFDDPGFKHNPLAPFIATFSVASGNAWELGRADLAQARMAQVVAAVNPNNPYDLAYSGFAAALLRLEMREYEQAEALAVRPLELSEKLQFQMSAAYSRCILGYARAQLGRTTGSVALIRQGINTMLEVGARLGISRLTTYLAGAQERDGDIVNALATVEQALRENPDELTFRPEILRLRGDCG